MKLVIQIPCYNEEKTLPDVVSDLPKKIPGVDVIEILVVDDGSTDGTRAVAKKLGAHHIVALKKNEGLAHAFQAGIDAALDRGADIIVNTDGDHQYKGTEIQKIIQPILDGRADVVIGDRNPSENPEFPILKRLLQRWGSSVVALFAGQHIPDAVSGFRAYSREAALRTNIVSPFSYTVESIIQLANKNINVVSVPVEVNPKTRTSRLVKNIPDYVRRSASTLLRIYVMHAPLKSFLTVAILLLLAALGLGVRFLAFFIQGNGTGHIQSLILSTILSGGAFVVFLLAVLSDVIAYNRRMLEEILYRLKKDK